MSFVVTAGQLQAVQRAPGDYQSLAPMPAYIRLTPTVSTTYEQLWRTQPALRTVVGFLARNIAQLGLDPYEKVSTTDRRKLTTHPLAGLLERPFPNTKWTKYRLVNNLMHELCVYDNAYWLKLRDGGVRALVPIPNRMITPIGDSWFAPEKYRIRGDRGYEDVPADDIVHFHGYNPDDPRQGVAPIETLRMILAEEYAATGYREQMWRNGARVGGYIKRPKDAPKWSETARTNFRADWQALYGGDGAAAGGTPVLEDGMEFAPSGVTPRDAQYVESRRLTREEVAVAYHVSPVMLGLMEGATFSNINELHRMLYQDTLAPWLTQISQDIECQLLADIDPLAAQTGRIYVEFNLSEKLRGSFEEQAKALQSAVGAPWMTRDEARAIHNLPQVAGADELIVPLNVITGGLASPNDTAPDNPSNEASNGQLPKAARVAVRTVLKRQESVVLSRLGAGKTDVDVLYHRDRWNAVLADELREAGQDDEHATALAATTNAEARALLAAALNTEDPKRSVRYVFAELDRLAESGGLWEMEPA